MKSLNQLIPIEFIYDFAEDAAEECESHGDGDMDSNECNCYECILKKCIDYNYDDEPIIDYDSDCNLIGNKDY